MLDYFAILVLLVFVVLETIRIFLEPEISPVVMTQCATLDCPILDVRTEDGKLLYEKRWYHRGQPVFVEGRDIGKCPANIIQINTEANTNAIAHLTISSEGIQGTIYFQTISKGVRVNGTISNLKPHSKHGFHVHEVGKLDNYCKAAGSHFNPFNKDHGDRENYLERHVGDLGNIVANENGVAEILFDDEAISLDRSKESCILNRALVVHADEDDLGKGLTEDSLKTGNAGARIACGIIIETF